MMCFWPDSAMTATSGLRRRTATISRFWPLESGVHTPPATKWL